MKRKFLKLFACILAALSTFAFSFSLSACGKLNLLKENTIEDDYDNYYQIFVRSYYDSDGNGIGDFNGIAEKLDYIRDMGYTGIWLMPINPSPSYHGYDVTDYYNVNSQYGTLQDYDNLITKAHEKGIKIIIDLVVNHSSDQHPWFKQGAAFQNGQGGSAKYSGYYNWSPTMPTGKKYSKVGNVYYESQFDKSMPDFNISNAELRQEIDNIIKFWISDRQTDGFRLDGCYYYSSEGTDQSAEFCKFIHDTAVKYNENAYIVGECWGPDRVTLKNTFYQSGVESFFDFNVTEEVVKAINSNAASQIWNSVNKTVNAANGNVAAPFLSNHDNGKGRIAGKVGRDEEKIKFAYGLLSVFSGNTFTYYGDEIGMTAVKSGSDPDLRIGMLWDDIANVTKPPFGASQNPEYLFGSVKDQLANNNSILNYYKLCNNTRNAFPALMRGAAERVSYDDSEVLIMKKTYGGQSVTVVINLSVNDKSVNGIEGNLAQSICVKGNIKKSGSALKMPKYSIAILT